MTAIKICGVTNVADAIACVELGVDAIGLNFVDRSPRAIDEETARGIADAIAGRALIVAVVADRSADEARALAARVGARCLQLHGDESPETLRALLPHAYKAIRVRDVGDVEAAAAFPGDHLLVDAKVEGVRGGSGRTFDWSLVEGLARSRKLTLAGGLNEDNVARAIARVRPFCVDVASGVETRGDVRTKDRERIAAFVAAVRAA